MNNYHDTKRSTYSIGNGTETMNLCDKPRQHNHRNEYAKHDEQFKQYDDDLAVIEWSNDM